MIRLLLWTLLFGVVILTLRRLGGVLDVAGPRRRQNGQNRRDGREGRGGPAQSAAPSPDGALVRDRVCNTFLPRERAIELTGSGETRYFCSVECRDRFVSGSARGSDAA